MQIFYEMIYKGPLNAVWILPAVPKCCFKHPRQETNLLFQNSVIAAKNKVLSIMRKIRATQQEKAQYFSSVSPVA